MKNLERTDKGLKAYDPWRDFFNLESFFPFENGRQSKSLPAVNISEDDKQYSVDVIAPGFKKEDFKIKVDDDVLSISAETKQESSENGNGKQYSRREYSYSSFTRTFRLPDNTKDDQISASYTDGILKLSIPKSKEQTKATKEIAIN
ncbi:Hsp20/alpha crystallin family protein [Chitinophaga niabensis]|uniref:Hsp20/alpha crystallin family protein n=1 Tax=Chitinophaga niabensis TaxID=536979 RepID=UPI0031BA5FAB